MDTLVFGQNEDAYVGAIDHRTAASAGGVVSAAPRSARSSLGTRRSHRPWWSTQKELGQQGAGVVLVGPEPVGVRFGNALSEPEARFVLEAIGSVPPT